MQLIHKKMKLESALVDTTRCSNTVTNYVNSTGDARHVVLVSDLIDHDSCKNEKMVHDFMSAGLETCRLDDVNCLMHTGDIPSKR